MLLRGGSCRPATSIFSAKFLILYSLHQSNYFNSQHILIYEKDAVISGIFHFYSVYISNVECTKNA